MRREMLALLLLVAGCSDFHLFGRRETEDTEPDTEDTEDTGDTGDTGDTDEDCPSGPVTIQWGVPSASGEPGCSDWEDTRCATWGYTVAPGREDGEPRAWIHTDPWGGGKVDPDQTLGLYLLSWSDWELPVSEDLEPRILTDQQSQWKISTMELGATMLTVDADHPGEGVWVFHAPDTEEYEDHQLHLFTHPPASRTLVSESEATLASPSQSSVLPLELSSADVDGDGLDDLVTWRNGFVGASLWLSPLSGTLAGEDDRSDSIDLTEDSPLQGLWNPVLADLDQDGHVDLLFSTVDDRFEDLDPQLAVVYGPLLDHEPVDVPDLSVSSGAGDTRTGFAERNSLWGHSIVVPGDLTGDGHPDVAITAKQDERFSEDEGWLTWVLDDLGTGTRVLEEEDLHLLWEDWDPSGIHNHGYPIAPGDMDGDGQVDLVLFNEDASPASKFGSRAYLVPGPITETLSLPGGSVPFHLGVRSSGWQDLFPVGDLDQDGQDDLVFWAMMAELDDSDEEWTRVWLLPGCSGW